MKLLLDTHAFLWRDNDQTRLSDRALAACRDPANSLHLSVASVWELQIKTQLGKITMHLALATILDDQRRNGLAIATIGVDDVLELSTLPGLHRDPFDRLLIAQARRGGFRLVSHDSKVAGYDVSILW